jgi:phospholipid transport system substrate-binding protein
MKSPAFTLIALIFLLCPGNSALAQTADAEARLRSAIDQVLDIAMKSGGQRGFTQQLRPVLEKYLCFESMTRRAVGRGWREFSSPDQSKATELFTTLIIRTYSEGFTPGERPVIRFGQTKTPAPDRAEIATTTSYKGNTYEVVYRLEKKGDWRVTDVVIEGVSLVSNYRAQFDSLFKKGGASAVLDSLQKSAARNP